MLQENFVATIAGSLRRHWEVDCYSDLDGGTLTYGEVGNLIHSLHAAFAAAGIARGDRIGVVGRNSAHWCVSYLAATTYGTVIVPILPDFTSAEIEHIVRHSGSRLLFLADGVFDRLEESKMDDLSAVVRLTDFSVTWSREAKFGERFNAARASAHPIGPDDVAFPAVANDELAAIVYTSGTTGFSKGVMLDGNSLIANILFFNASVALTPGDNMVSFLPLAHVFGCAFDFLAPTVAGCHIVYVEKIPTPKILVAAFQKYRPVVVMSVPLVIEKIYRNRIKPVLETPKMQLLLKVPGLNKLVYKKIHDQVYEVFGGRFKEMVIGGAAINRDIEDFFRRIGLRMTCGYGMTECGPLISYSVYDDRPPTGSVGRIVPTMECRIADADPETGIGEVQVRGENRMMGYYHDEEATAEAIDPDGWLHTGDPDRCVTAISCAPPETSRCPKYPVKF